MAAIAGLEALNRPCEIELYSDSQYLVKAFNEHWLDGWIKKGWKRGKNEPVKNVDLWKRLLEAKKPHQVTFHWVKGHAGHEMRKMRFSGHIGGRRDRFEEGRRPGIRLGV